MVKQGYTHKWQKDKSHPWRYLKLLPAETTVTETGKTVLTFTDELQAFRSYYEEDVVELV